VNGAYGWFSEDCAPYPYSQNYMMPMCKSIRESLGWHRRGSGCDRCGRGTLQPARLVAAAGQAAALPATHALGPPQGRSPSTRSQPSPRPAAGPSTHRTGSLLRRASTTACTSPTATTGSRPTSTA
jgi:hypothetical protein